MASNMFWNPTSTVSKQELHGSGTFGRLERESTALDLKANTNTPMGTLRVNEHQWLGGILLTSAS